VIRNGVDDAVFTPSGRRRPPRRTGGPWHVVVSSWSSDENKGWSEYLRLDALLAGRGDVELTVVGRPPPGARFRHARTLGAQPPDRLAATLRDADVLLQLARWETCSNALLEGLACGLAAVYLDSGANAEVAAPYGVAWGGDLLAALGELEPRFEGIVERLQGSPFGIGPVADRYQEVLESVAAGREPAVTALDPPA
jgi:glycosyltransferase involved in cell wall biosynthesis